MPFDINSAVDIQGQKNSAIATTSFDILTAEEANPKPVKSTPSISGFLRSIFRNSTLEQIKTVTETMDIFPQPKKEEKWEDYKNRVTESLKPRERDIISQGVLRQVDAPMTVAIGVAAAGAPLATAAGVAGFSIKDHFFNARRLIEDKAPGTPLILKDIAEILDLVATASVLGMSGKTIKDFTFRRLKNINAPKSVVLDSTQVDAIKNTPQATETLGIKPEHIEASINSGVPIQVPMDKVVNLATTPEWGKIKEDLLSIEKVAPQRKPGEIAEIGGKPIEINPELPSAKEMKPPSTEIGQPLVSEQQKVEIPVSVPSVEKIAQERGFIKSVKESEKIEPLITEAKKYKTAEEFVNSDIARAKYAELNKEADSLVVRKKQLSELTAIEGTAKATRENRRLIGEVEKMDKRIAQIGKEKFNLESQLTSIWEQAQGKGIEPPAKPPTAVSPGPEGKERGFITSVKESPQITKETKTEIGNLPEAKTTYQVYTDKEALAKAQEKVLKNPEGALAEVLTSESVNKDITTTGLELMRKYREEGNIEQEVNVAENLAKKGTEGGQFIQAFSILDKLSPDGVLVFAQRELNRGVEVSKRKLITPDFADSLKKQAQRIKDAPEGYAKVIEVKKLTEMIAEKKGRSVSDWIIEVANIPRTLAASLMDFSFGLRQGIFLLPSFPKEWGKAFGKQFGAFAKEENYNAVMDSIMKHPDYQIALDSGLSFTDIRTKLIKVEEKYMGASLAEKIPIIGKGVIATQRAYTAMANIMRLGVFSKMFHDYKNVGVEITPKLLKQTATFVNAGTGRGGLAGEFGKSAGLLNAFFFSPRLMSSRLTLLNPAYYITREPILRKQALKSLFSFIGFGTTILTMAKLMGADVGTDPRSSDFGKIKIGNTRIDTWGGFQQYVRMFAQEVTGEYVSSTTGKKVTLGEGYRPLTRMEILMRQIESKEAPVFSLITKLLGENRDWETGGKMNVPKEILQKFEPMVVADLYDLYKEDPMLLPLGALTIFGAGVQTYKSKKKNKF